MLNHQKTPLRISLCPPQKQDSTSCSQFSNVSLCTRENEIAQNSQYAAAFSQWVYLEICSVKQLIDWRKYYSGTALPFKYMEQPKTEGEGNATCGAECPRDARTC